MFFHQSLNNLISSSKFLFNRQLLQFESSFLFYFHFIKSCLFLSELALSTISDSFILKLLPHFSKHWIYFMFSTLEVITHLFFPLSYCVINWVSLCVFWRGKILKIIVFIFSFSCSFPFVNLYWIHFIYLLLIKE